jgi:hypothetical protein
VAAVVGERQSQKLTLTNNTPHDACYKIKTTCVARYAVLPGQAVIPANMSVTVEIVLIKTEELPDPGSLRDRFLIQAAWKEDPNEDVTAFWKRPHDKPKLFQKKFSSELFLPDETAKQIEEERELAAAELQTDTALEDEMERIEAEAAAAAAAARDAERAQAQRAEAERVAQEAEEDARRREAALAKKNEAEKAAEVAALQAEAEQRQAAEQAKVKAAAAAAAAAAPAPAPSSAAPASAPPTTTTASRVRSSGGAAPSVMRLSIPDTSQLLSNPVGALSEYGRPLAEGLRATPGAGAALAMAHDTSQLDEGLLSVLFACVLLLLTSLIFGLSCLVTLLAFFPPAALSVRMLGNAPNMETATAMPLYWIVFSLLLLVESVGIAAWIPMYTLVKAGVLLWLWGFTGAEMLFTLA